MRRPTFSLLGRELTTLGRELTTARLAARSQYSAASTMSAFAAEFMGPLSFANCLQRSACFRRFSVLSVIGGWCTGRQSAVCIRLLTLRSSHCENQIRLLRVKPGPSRGSCGWARFRFNGHDAAFSLLECLHDVKGVRGHSRSPPSMERGRAPSGESDHTRFHPRSVPGFQRIPDQAW
jgi:hypothetical protein